MQLIVEYEKNMYNEFYCFAHIPISFDLRSSRPCHLKQHFLTNTAPALMNALTCLLQPVYLSPVATLSIPLNTQKSCQQ